MAAEAFSHGAFSLTHSLLLDLLVMPPICGKLCVCRLHSLLTVRLAAAAADLPTPLEMLLLLNFSIEDILVVKKGSKERRKKGESSCKDEEVVS